MNVPVSPLYAFKNFTDLTKQESDEVLHGRNDPEVRRWMCSDRVISEEDHRRFMGGLQGNPQALYVRIERAGRFAGVYSLNNIADGSGLGGFWVTAYTRERFLALNVVFQGMDFMFEVREIGQIYACQKTGNHGVIKLNGLLGVSLSESVDACDDSMQRVVITQQDWRQKTTQDARLFRLMDRMEKLNGTT